MKKFSFIIGVLGVSLLTWITNVWASMGSGANPGPGYWALIQWLIEHGWLH
jgi:hypothetical protein